MATKLLVPNSLNKETSYNYTLKKLWLHPDNIRYNKIQIIFAIKCYNIDLYPLLKSNISVLSFVDDYMSDFSDPYFADEFNKNHKNVLNALHSANKKFIITTAKEIINNPGILDSDYGYNFYGDLEKLDSGNKEIDNSAFADGRYQPEALFLNRKQTYWKPLNVEVDFTKRGVYNRLTGGAEQNYQDTNARLYEVYKRNYAPLNDTRLEEKTAYPSRLGY